MKFDLQNIFMAPSRDGVSFQGTFLINDKPVCYVRDRGDGGASSYDIYDHDMFMKWEQLVSELPPIYWPDYQTDIKIDTDFFIVMLHAALVNGKKFSLLLEA